MRVTRSASRAASTTAQAAAPAAPAATPKPAKRKAAPRAAPSKKARTDDDDVLPPPPKPPVVRHITPVPAEGDAEPLVPAELTFEFADAKQHLVRADPRFADVFDRLKCRPFEHLERVDPFRTLAHSILGQQISWLAARSITHKFCRLFDPSLPEKPNDHHSNMSFFPTCHQVIQKDIPTLRTAGLSQRKAEYILDLAARFADGRLSTEKLLEAEDEDLYELLTAVRGIGRWTVDMFAIFSLRRPDILPVGDLGVQRGLLRWFLALHAPDYSLTISPKKLPRPDEDPAENSQRDAPDDVLPALAETAASAADASAAPPAPKGRKGKKAAKAADADAGSALPTPFTPSIHKILHAVPRDAAVAPLPKGLTAAQLRTRLEKKTKIKGAFLTPQEMEELTAPWRPYRSLGVYYMWALAEDPGAK
ncbi:DNA glycosylase [Phanerochaete sordida]|uniref:DNA glycosylase n=1 Tax=Phanerochaete sordida TaxID=48140 RepID=A0A9P3GHE6_9APHY|nr:DNA glycosylase [Phanerochaete sordida]